MKKVKLLLIDNYDSFTFNLYDYFLQLDVDCQVIRNDELSLEAIQQVPFDALVLSPGPKTPRDAGLMMDLIEAYYLDKPILGICLGHQGIGEFFGAKLEKAPLPMHGKTSQLLHRNHALFHNLPQEIEVMRYHSLLLNDLEKTNLQIIAETKKGATMAIAHRYLPIVGVQFHPESILTQHGLEMLDNWLQFIELNALHIRSAKAKDIPAMAQLCQRVFKKHNAPRLSAEGQSTFLDNFATVEQMTERFAKGHHFEVAEIAGQVVGMFEVRPPIHLALLYIENGFHQRKIGSRLLLKAISICKKKKEERTFMTVNSEPTAWRFYQKFSFEKTQEVQEANGIKYIPMRKVLV